MTASLRPSPAPTAPDSRARHANPGTARQWTAGPGFRAAVAAALVLVPFWHQVEVVGTWLFVGVLVAVLYGAGCLGLG